MAKDKVKGPRAMANKHLAARTAFLHNAAALLASQVASSRKLELLAPTAPQDVAHSENPNTNMTLSQPRAGGLPFLLAAQLKQVALKSQIRLQTDVKRTICRACNAILIVNQTCTNTIENGSRKGKKERADVSITECHACGSKSRVPIGANRQQRKTERVVREAGSAARGHAIPQTPTKSSVVTSRTNYRLTT